MEIISGRIVDAAPGYIVIRACYDNTGRMIRRRYEEVEIGLKDGRRITPEQRRKAFALVGEIAAHTGYERDEAHLTLKHEFMNRHLEQLQKELFSLSDCDMTTAREYISYLIEFCLTFDVPTKMPLADLCDDVERYVYSCLIHKKCCVCGKRPSCTMWIAWGWATTETRSCTKGGNACLYAGSITRRLTIWAILAS